jgi:hypothetical protein
MATIRVAVNNNFNCTPAEFAQLDKFSDQYPEHQFFVNCNIVTPKLLDLNDNRAKLLLNKATHSLTNTYICDKAGLGCQGCGLCSKLTTGNFKPVYSLNLSTSGICKYSCESCYAKTMQKFLIGCGKNPIKFDVIQMNTKQKGTTKHIINMKNKEFYG